VQRNLNFTCLRTAVKLLDRLQLRPLDGIAGDSSGPVSRLFHQYSENLLKGLDYCQLESSPLDNTLEAAAVQQTSS
jgi:neurofibromin 1